MLLIIEHLITDTDDPYAIVASLPAYAGGCPWPVAGVPAGSGVFPARSFSG
jgi:hypothetical protein